MRLERALICALSFLLLGASPVAAGPKASDPCALPVGLHGQISRTYRGRVVTMADLEDYGKKLFKKDHGNRCPGLAKVDFYGDGKPTWALVLITGENPKRKAQLVVAHQIGVSWETRLLETTDGTPVVWTKGPGKYRESASFDSASDRTLRATNPVIVFCGLESWAIVYVWNGKEVEKIQTSD